jgi:hypothetical protein
MFKDLSQQGAGRPSQHDALAGENAPGRPGTGPPGHLRRRGYADPRDDEDQPGEGRARGHPSPAGHSAADRARPKDHDACPCRFMDARGPGGPGWRLQAGPPGYQLESQAIVQDIAKRPEARSRRRLVDAIHHLALLDRRAARRQALSTRAREPVPPKLRGLQRLQQRRSAPGVRHSAPRQPCADQDLKARSVHGPPTAGEAPRAEVVWWARARIWRSSQVAPWRQRPGRRRSGRCGRPGAGPLGAVRSGVGAQLDDRPRAPVASVGQVGEGQVMLAAVDRRRPSHRPFPPARRSGRDRRGAR